MLPVPAEEPVVSPILTAGLLLAAIPSLTALGLARPSAAEVLDATSASKTRAYEIRAEILTILPSLLRPAGRPPDALIPASDTGAISRSILAFLMGHPGAAVKAASRHTYSDGFRHRVIELAEQHVEVGIAQLAEAVGVPAATVQDWLLAVPAPTPPCPARPTDDGEPTHARIASVLAAWRRWDGGFSAFCVFVRTELAIDYGDTLIRRILNVHAGRRTKRRAGRSPDEKATRKKIMGIVMDSRTPAEPKPDAEKNLAIQLLKLFAPAEVALDFEHRLRAGGLGYGDLKKALFEYYWNYFAAPRARRAELAANLDHVNAVLKDGAERARVVADQVLARTRLACGLR